MALQTLFGSATKVTGVTPTFQIARVMTAAGGGVVIDTIFTGVAPLIIPANFRVVDFEAWNNTGGAQAGAATAQLFSVIAGAGGAAISDAVAIQNDDARGRAATLDPVQADLTARATDTLYITKDADSTAGIAWVTAYLL